MCPVSPCLNDSPCVMINSVPTCFCVPGTNPPYCGTNSPVTTPAGLSSCSNYSLCYGASPCLSINGIDMCFCMPGTIPPYCMPAPVANTTTTSTTESSRLPTTTTASTTTDMVMAANCPVNNLCNGSPCIEINGQEQCFCMPGTIPPYCLPAPVPTTTSISTTESSRLPTTTIASTTTNMIMTDNCPVNNLCNGSPCLEVNGEEQCFCSAGTIPPYCLPVPVPTTTQSTTTTSPPIRYSYCNPGSPFCGGNKCVFIDDVLNCCDPVMPPPDSFCLIGGMTIPPPPNSPPPTASPPPPTAPPPPPG